MRYTHIAIATCRKQLSVFSATKTAKRILEIRVHSVIFNNEYLIIVKIAKW